jgi:glycosyltransferase involved in cell wall biosynthesis
MCAPKSPFRNKACVNCASGICHCVVASAAFIIRDAPIPPADHPRAPIILNVGHVAWRKGQGVLTEAFAKIAINHPGWQLQLAGYDADGSTVRHISQIIKEHRLEDRIIPSA